MKQELYRLFEHQYLSRDESKKILLNIANGCYNDSQIAAFITVYLMRSISIDEMAGFREALLEMSLPVDLSEYNPIDIVGTGGDNKNTFNISTASSFVVAGAGYKVVKHGNYGATSVSGASNVIEQHGVKFTGQEDKLRRSLEECNIAYLHAPLFNPALKNVAHVRKDLAVRTFFNMLGPLVNPTIPKRQMLGVYNLKLARLYLYTYQQTDSDFAIVHSLDGYDEISLTGLFKVIDPHGETLYSPEELGFKKLAEQELSGGDTVQEAAVIFNNILANRSTEAQRNVVIINTAFAIRIFEPKKSIEECIAIARESIESGKAKAAFDRFIVLNS